MQNPTSSAPAPEPNSSELNPMAKPYTPKSERPNFSSSLPPFAFVPGTRNVPEKYKHIHVMTEAELAEDKKWEKEFRQREQGVVYYNRK